MKECGRHYASADRYHHISGTFWHRHCRPRGCDIILATIVLPVAINRMQDYNLYPNNYADINNGNYVNFTLCHANKCVSCNPEIP